MTFLRRTQLPTWLVAIAIYAGWIALTLNANAIPLWALIPLGGYVVAWHGSLQHEVIHGHPTRWQWVNEALALPPLSIYLPFSIYRESHIQHHEAGELTDPATDPESRYVSPPAWAAMGPLRRALYWIERPLLGRMVVGPLTTTVRTLVGEAAQIARGDTRHVLTWLVHIGLVSLLTLWLLEVCHVSFARYLIGFAYPGLSLTLLRSFREHRPAVDQVRASAIVEAGPVTRLLFLNNNLHALHHAEPSLPWYELPARFEVRRAEILARIDGFTFTGYLQMFARHGVVPIDAPPHQSRAALRAARDG